MQVLLADRPSMLADHGFTTAYIPQVSFEKPAVPTRMQVGLQADGMGCAPERLPVQKRSLSIVPDDFQHEQASCFNLRVRGLVVMASCGHRGIVNSVRAAMKGSGVDEVHGVLGGFHLIPMHCAGLTFYEVARQELPGRVLLSSTGTRFTFGA